MESERRVLSFSYCLPYLSSIQRVQAHSTMQQGDSASIDCMEIVGKKQAGRVVSRPGSRFFFFFFNFWSSLAAGPWSALIARDESDVADLVVSGILFIIGNLDDPSLSPSLSLTPHCIRPCYPIPSLISLLGHQPPHQKATPPSLSLCRHASSIVIGLFVAHCYRHPRAQPFEFLFFFGGKGITFPSLHQPTLSRVLRPHPSAKHNHANTSTTTTVPTTNPTAAAHRHASRTYAQCTTWIL